MSRRLLMVALLAMLGFGVTGDGWVHAARCTPLSQGKCHACSNCRYCKHCAHQGGRCSVCR